MFFLYTEKPPKNKKTCRLTNEKLKQFPGQLKSVYASKFKNSITNDNLFKLFKIIKKSFRKDHNTTEIFLDIEKAFDQIWFEGFFFKPTPMGRQPQWVLTRN